MLRLPIAFSWTLFQLIDELKPINIPMLTFECWWNISGIFVLIEIHCSDESRIRQVNARHRDRFQSVYTQSYALLTLIQLPATLRRHSNTVEHTRAIRYPGQLIEQPDFGKKKLSIDVNKIKWWGEKNPTGYTFNRSFIDTFARSFSFSSFEILINWLIFT